MSSPNPRAGGDPFSRQRNPNAPPRSGRSPPTSPERGAATVAVGELFSDLSIRRPQPAGNDDDDDLIVAEMTGVGAPAPIEDLEDVGLAAAVLENVGYNFPTLLQSFSIPVVMAGRDLLVVSSATSTGTSAAFCLPVVSRLLQTGPGQRMGIPMPRTVILAPTIQRATAINEEVKKCSYNTHISVVMVIAGSSMICQVRDLQKGVDILVATPERLVEIVERSTLSFEATQYFIVDGIDRMLDMGLEPMIRKIVELGMPQKSVRQTMIFTGTLRPEIQRVASDFLSDQIFITIGRVMPAEHIKQKVVFVSEEGEKKPLLLLLLADEVQRALKIIFVETCSEADSLSSWLCNQGFAATCFHGYRTQQERESAIKFFKSGLVPILVASDAVSWGLDVQNIAHVINYDLPKRIDGYIHRIRRAGKRGLAMSFFTESDQHLADGLAKVMTRMKQDVPDWLVGYAHKLELRMSDHKFDYLVDKFINAISVDVKANLPFDDNDYKAVHQRQTNEYANSALLYHNGEGDKKIKYELVEAITSCGIMDSEGLYAHVNFTAMNTENSKVDLFFAELHWDSDKKASVPTRVVLLEENHRVGGLYGTDCSNYKDGMNIGVDLQHCYACGADLKHPRDGELYEIGHKAISECYGYDP